MKIFTVSLAMLLLLGCGAGGLPAAAINFALIDHIGIGLGGSDFCCEPAKLPQEIATVRVSNNFEATTIKVVIGPFSNGVRTQDGQKTDTQLKPGEVLDTKLLSTHCDWTKAEGPLVVSVTVEDFQGFLPREEKVERKIVLENKCQTRIETNLEVSGLARAHFDTQADPPTMGTSPLLYVIGQNLVNGIEAYSIEVDATTKKITNTAPAGGILFPSGGDDDVVPVSAGTGAGLTRALYAFGPLGLGRSHWAGTAWGGIATSANPVRDLVSYGGDSRAPGVSYAVGSTVQFEEYDANANFFNGLGVAGALGGEFHFPNKTGDPASVFVHEDKRGAIIVMNGSPGQVWFHDRKDTLKPAVLVGAAGNDPRQVRAKNGLAVISNYGSNSITILKWDGASKPAVVTQALMLGASPLPKPRTIDMIVLDSGKTAVVVGSGSTNRWWLGELNANGGVDNQWEGNAVGAAELSDILFLPGPVTYLAAAVKGSKVVQLIETTLKSPPQ